MESSYVMCWAAKWLGEKEVHFSSMMETTHRRMIRKVHKLLDEADAVIHYNGTKFDIPTLNKDLLKTSRQKFKFPSNKLDYVAQALELGEKVKHIGHELWIKCMNKDKDAWNMMKKYNIHDVVLLEKVYEKMLAWIKNHPNQNAYHDGTVCPTCGGSNLIKRGVSCNSTHKYQRYVCRDCNTWSRGNKSLLRGKSSLVSV
jgi:uncharacterized protein YprB with RNaseH-like and TPR domain